MLKNKQKTIIYQTRKTRKGQYVKSCQWDWVFFTRTIVQTTRACWKYYGAASGYAVEVTNTSLTPHVLFVLSVLRGRRRAPRGVWDGCLTLLCAVSGRLKHRAMLRAAVRSVTCCVEAAGSSCSPASC